MKPIAAVDFCAVDAMCMDDVYAAAVAAAAAACLLMLNADVQCVIVVVSWVQSTLTDIRHYIETSLNNNLFLINHGLNR